MGWMSPSAASSGLPFSPFLPSRSPFTPQMKSALSSSGVHRHVLVNRPLRVAARSLAALLGVALLTPLAIAQSFDYSKLIVKKGFNTLTKGTTSVQFGPDGRLYLLQQTGQLSSVMITRSAEGVYGYVESDIDVINLVMNIQNHDDNGTLNNEKQERQATGLLVAGTAESPVLYVSSCDWREGAGAGHADDPTGNDLNLDTNSGVISRLTKVGGVWQKVDIVRGLPRSEENHSCNGLQIDPNGTKLYLAQGGNTNGGGPSHNFAYASEYALSASILAIDLAAIEAMPVQTDAQGQKYIYNLPTLNDIDPIRADSTQDVVVRWNATGGIQRVGVPGAGGVISMADGGSHTLALKSDGTVLAWGSNTNGQTTLPAGLAAVQAVAAGATHSVALKNDGTVVAWGNNGSTQTKVPGGLSGVEKISAGTNHTLALKNDGSVVAWGADSGGQSTVPPTAASGVQRIAAGGSHSLALKADGSVIAWGSNANGQTTVPPEAASGIAEIAAGGSHSLALKSDGTVIAWGSNGAGQCTVPAGLTGVIKIAAGTTHSAALKGDGSVVAWGDNGLAQSSIPAGLSGVDGLSAGGNRTLALASQAVDANDPFGGNDGFNQAKLLPGEPVQIHASGFRNPYDILIARTGARAGKMYTFDNAPNPTWGGHPKNEGLPPIGQPSTVTNEVIAEGSGQVANLDGLHLVTPGYYGGHPNPIRANPTGAGWTFGGPTGPSFATTLPVDWPPVHPSLADPREGDYRKPGSAETTGLFFQNNSTTGLDEYTAPNFNGAMTGNIIATCYTGDQVVRLTMSESGSAVTSSSLLFSGSDAGGSIDVAIPRLDTAASLFGTIFIAHHNNSGLTILEPSDFSGGGITCTGLVSATLDDDHDGFSNQDEHENGSDPCSGSSRPADRDGDFLSDLNDADDDNDGILDTQDVFAIDRLNGTDLGPPFLYKLFNYIDANGEQDGGGRGLFKIGLTGLMLNPGQDYSEMIDHLGDLIGGGAGGFFTDPEVGAGNPRGATNTQKNAFQFGVNISEATGPFRARCSLGGDLFNEVPTGNQSHGVYIGNGDQDNYVMVALHANSGAGGIEVVHEEDGVVFSSIVHPASGLFVTGVNITLEFLVDPVAGTVLPGYAINANPPIYVGSPVTVSGKILDVLRGSNGMAFGMAATTNGGPTFGATWDDFMVDRVLSTATARFSINEETGGTLNNSSSNTGMSFKLTNTSTGGQKIVSAKLELGTAMLPDVVFDPLGTAGDTDGKAFSLDQFDGTGTPAGIFSSPKNGVDGNDGYQTLTVDCSGGVTFNPGDDLYFSADVDPTSVKGVAGPGPFHAASINGLELSGSTITVTFDDGMVRKFRVASNSVTNPNRSSLAVLGSDSLATPRIEVAGQSSPMTLSAQPTIRVSGSPGKTAQVWTYAAALHLSEPPTYVVPNGGYDLDPFEANSVTAYAYTTVTIPESGFIDVQPTLSSANGGINYVVAVLMEVGGGKRSSASNILTMKFDPNATGDALKRVNAGGPQYTDSFGKTWQADTGFSTGTSQNYGNPIDGTEDDAIYQSFHFASAPLDYTFTVPDGNYQVKLHFAETWSGVDAPGERVFDVLLEGELALDNLDVFGEVGANTALVKTLVTHVSDGQLTIGLRQVVQNPFISGIELYYLGGGPPPDLVPPAAPASLSATNLKAGSLTLTWPLALDNVGVTGYRIFRDNVVLGTISTLSYPQTGLTPETEYDYEIEAYDAAGNISPRTTLTVTTPADSENPTPPFNLRGSAGNGSATLTWQPATDDAAVTGYRVYRDSVLIDTVTGLTFSEEGLTNGTNYTYEVRAIDASGKASTPVTAIVRPRAVAGAVYRIDCGLAAGTTTDSLGNVWVAGVVPWHNDVGLFDNNNVQIAGTTDDVIYRSRHYDGPSGQELKFTLPVSNGDYELRLHFAETTPTFLNPGQRVFDVKVQNQLILDNFDIVATAGFATALVVPIPATATDGAVTVEFLHTGVNNPVISGIELYELEPPPPDVLAPTTPGSLVVSGTTAGSISLSWSESADNVGVTGYRVSRDGGAPVTVTGTSYTDVGLLPGTLHNYSVTAVDAATNASAAAVVQGSTLPDTTAPTAPGSLLATSGNANATLSWLAATDDVGVTGYRIYKDNVLIDTVSGLVYTATGLVNETTYVFEVTAIDGTANESAPVQSSATPRALGAVLYRIDCGKTDVGYSYVDPLGNTWARDEFFNASNTNVTTVTTAITGTSIPEIYKSFHSKQRTSSTPLKYEFPVTNGNYEVRLHFAETSASGTLAGYRKFNVLLEGSNVLANIDVFAEAGGQYKALVKTLPAAISDGVLTLDFTNATPTPVQNPFVSGIEIFPILSGGAGETVPPTTPGDLQASNLTGTSVTLGWTASTDNVGVTGYRIFRNSVLIDTVTGLSFTNTGLTPNTLYNYSVMATDAANNASTPATLGVTTLNPDLQAPTTPGNLLATPWLSHIDLTWDASTDDVGVTGYRVYRGGNLLATVTTPGYTESGLASNTAYAYEVFAVDAANNTSTAAQVSTATPADTQAPTAPGNLAGTPGFTTMALSWAPSTDNAGVTGYRVYRGEDLVTTVAALDYLDAGLIPGTGYHYLVRAIDSAGNVSDEAVLDTATLADTQAPATPPGFDATAGNQSVVLSWAPASDNVGVASYEILRDGDVIATVPTPGYTDSGLTNGVLYTYQVRALDAAGNLSGAATDAATPRSLGANAYRVDAGYTGAPFQDLAGNTWEADTSYLVFGGAASTGNAISGTGDDAIYQTERYDSSSNGSDLSFDFPLAAGSYEVRLHFAETYSGITATGDRVFDVNAEGNLAIDDLDIFARVGLNTALVVSFPLEVTDGVLDLEFLHGTQNPKVCAIEIFAIDMESGTPTFEQWLASYGLTGQTASDSDAGGLSNLEEFELQMDPNDPNDDLTFSLKVEFEAGTPAITLPVLKPIGNYYVHRDTDLDDIGNVANRIDIITRAEIEAMTPAERAGYTVEDSGGGARAFYQLFFEPAAE